jgi:hypothetical protein
LNLNRPKKNIYYLLRRSHRTVGVFLIVFVLLLSGTGILLNHTDDLNLSNHYAPSFIAARYYPNGGKDRHIKGWLFQGSYYYALDGQLFRDNEQLGRCEDIHGVGRLDEHIIILCNGELLIMTTGHRLIERLDVAMGIPSGIDKMAVQDGRLIIADGDSQYAFDLESLVGNRLNPASIVDWPMAEDVPGKLLLSQSISWQQFILDVHSGIFIGKMGKWFSDLVAICLSGMAISGLAMWLRR